MTLAVAFFGGVISCLSPCVLPILPVFLAQLARPDAVSASGIRVVGARLRALGFILGFAGVFVLLWLSLGLVGFALLQSVPDLRVLAGAAIVVVGVAMIAGWKPSFSLGGRWGDAGSFGGSFLLGGGVALGWTPCIGLTLGAILTMAAASESILAGGALLVAYAAGMAVPLLVVGLGLTRVRSLMSALARHPRLVQGISGLFLVAIGLLVATNSFAQLAGLMPWTF